MEKKIIKLDQLTGLRYFAALLVFLSHSSWDGSDQTLTQVFESGYVGVSFFFVLSGFILSYSYKQKILGNGLSFLKYALLRLARLTPLHFLTALPFVALAFYKADVSLLKIVINLSYLQSWIPNSTYYFSFNAPSWSLSNEMFFYICFFPLIFLNTRNIVKITVLLLTVVIVSALVMETVFPGKSVFGEYSLAHWMFYIFPGFRLLDFLAGMLLFKVWQGGFRLPSWSVAPSYVLLIVAMYYAKSIPEPFRYSLYFLPVIVVFFYAHLTENTGIARFFSTKILVLLGNASFAFYLIHQRLIEIFRKLGQRLDLSNWSFALLTLAIITLISIVIYVLYERKAEMWLKSYIITKVK